MNKDKTKILEKFINEIAHTDVINTSKSFLKFIEYDKHLQKNAKSKNKKNINMKDYNNLMVKEDKYNKNIFDKNNYMAKENIVNNRYINIFNSYKNGNKSEKMKYNNDIIDFNNNQINEQ